MGLRLSDGGVLELPLGRGQAVGFDNPPHARTPFALFRASKPDASSHAGSAGHQTVSLSESKTALTSSIAVLPAPAFKSCLGRIRQNLAKPVSPGIGNPPSLGVFTGHLHENRSISQPITVT